jgi:hypothetical protein
VAVSRRRAPKTLAGPYMQEGARQFRAAPPLLARDAPDGDSNSVMVVMSESRMSYDDCVLKREEARLRAAQATSETARQEHLEIAELWDDICTKMKNNRLSGLTSL